MGKITKYGISVKYFLNKLFKPLNFPFWAIKTEKPNKRGKVMRFKPGDEVEVIGNAGGHNQIGLKGEVQTYIGMYVLLVNLAWNFAEQDLLLLPQKKEKVIARAEEARKRWLKYQEKVAYLENTGKAELDEDEFRKFAVTKIIDNVNFSADEKASRIHAVFSEDA